jgi:outer membrane protein insertion porin family
MVPPYNNLFAGGVRTVRGFRDGTLGPRDTPYGNPYGGQVRTTGQFNFFVPMPLESDGKSTRTAVFFDIGNVYARPSDFSVGDLRRSAGVSFAWFTSFLGLLEVSYAIPLNDKFGDRVENFQLNFGTGF